MFLQIYFFCIYLQESFFKVFNGSPKYGKLFRFFVVQGGGKSHLNNEVNDYAVDYFY